MEVWLIQQVHHDHPGRCFISDNVSDKLHPMADPGLHTLRCCGVLSVIVNDEVEAIPDKKLHACTSSAPSLADGRPLSWIWTCQGVASHPIATLTFVIPLISRHGRQHISKTACCRWGVLVIYRFTAHLKERKQVML